MQDHIKQKIRFWCEIALSVLTGVVALLFILQATDIYFSGVNAGDSDIYSRELVGERLMRLLAPILLWLVGIVACFVLSVFVPYEKKTKKRKTDYTSVCRRMKKRLPAGDSEEFLAEKKKLKDFSIERIAVWEAASIFALASVILSIVYLASPGNFPGDDLNAEVLRLVKSVFPGILSSLALFVFAVFYECYIAKRESECLKRLLILGKGAPMSESPYVKYEKTVQKAKPIATLVLRVAVAALGVTFLILGVLNEGDRDVLLKAINICTECIGLG